MVLVVKESHTSDSKAHAFVLVRRAKQGACVWNGLNLIFNGRPGIVDSEGTAASTQSQNENNNKKSSVPPAPKRAGPVPPVPKRPGPVQRLRDVVCPVESVTEFIRLAQPNTSVKIETCAVLAGEEREGQLVITALIVPT